MIRKLSVDQLKIGMFVRKFLVNWNAPDFRHKHPDRLGDPRLVESREDLQLIIDFGVKEVLIDTAFGDDLPGARKDVTLVEAALAAQVGEMPAPKDVPFEREIHKAAKVQDRTRQVVGDLMKDVRLGKQVTLAPVRMAVQEMAESMLRNPDAMLSLSMLRKKDDYTFMHSVNTGVILMAFCRSMEMDENTVHEAGIGGMLHDIGKMRIPERILNKPGPLNDQEQRAMDRHVPLGLRVLERTPGMSETVLKITAQHHERKDGSGYPKGLKGDQVSLIGQMAAIADVYDTMTSASPYAPAMEPHIALQKMMAWSDNLFDNGLFQKFVYCVGIYPIGTLVKLENGLLAVVMRSNRKSLLHPVIKAIIDAERKKRIEPKEVDLLDYKDDRQSGYAIERSESLKKWGVDPRQYMAEPGVYG